MKKPKTITPEMLTTLTTKLPEPYKTIVQFAAESGLRISDILKLRVHHVADRCMSVQEAKTKKFKRFDISDSLFVALRALCALKHDKDYIFNGKQFRTRRKPLNRSTVHRRIAKLVPGSAHSFRKLYAMNVFKTTGDIFAVQERLNHKYLSTTCTYLDIDINKLIKIAAEEVKSNS